MKIRVNEKKLKEDVVVKFKDVKQVRFEVEKNIERLVFKQEMQNLELRNKIGGIRNIIRFARQNEIETLEIQWSDLNPYFNFDTIEKNAEFLITNFLMANYEFDKFKTKKKGGYIGVKSISFVGINKKDVENFKKGIKVGEIVGLEVNNARDLSNSPANIVHPISLAEYVEEKSKNLKNAHVTILKQKDLEKLGAGGILAVCAGSQHEPRLIVMEYMGADKKNKPLTFVGKGVTHDNGGINIKPSSGGSIEEMHLDMSGASAVIHAFFILARLKVQKNIVAIVPAVENSVSGNSYRPGDIITMLSGKTVEVLNTDAEGRIILSDALTFAQEKFDSEIIIDVATLTGAALISLGTAGSPLMSNDDELAKKIIEIGNNKTGDFVWQFPLWDEFKKAVKNKRADIGNIPESNSRYGGSINGAMFLKEFIKEKQKWAHIDMAPRMTSTESDKLGNGAMGETVRLFVEMGRE